MCITYTSLNSFNNKYNKFVILVVFFYRIHQRMATKILLYQSLAFALRKGTKNKKIFWRSNTIKHLLTVILEGLIGKQIFEKKNVIYPISNLLKFTI